jgi:hypothetical protein
MKKLVPHGKETPRSSATAAVAAFVHAVRPRSSRRQRNRSRGQLSRVLKVMGHAQVEAEGKQVTASIYRIAKVKDRLQFEDGRSHPAGCDRAVNRLNECKASCVDRNWIMSFAARKGPSGSEQAKTAARRKILLRFEALRG